MSKLELHVELHAAWRVRGDRLSEEGRGDRSDVSDVVRMVNYIEGIQRDGDELRLFLSLGEREVMGHVQIEFDHAGTVHRIATDSGRAIVDNAVVVVIGARSHVNRLA